ncbi:MAG: hypothetical protein IT244_07780, partial [Bacteroidia bacterium]|nr:hypothetical protein [Bacteroidia bacterium]
MRLFVYFILVFFLVSCCFKKKHHEGRIIRANAMWMPDSCYAKLCMKEFGGSTDTLKPQESPKGYVLTTTTADCNEYLTEAQKIVYAAASSTPALGFEHESSENGEG